MGRDGVVPRHRGEKQVVRPRGPSAPSKTQWSPGKRIGGEPRGSCPDWEVPYLSRKSKSRRWLRSLAPRPRGNAPMRLGRAQGTSSFAAGSPPPSDCLMLSNRRAPHGQSASLCVNLLGCKNRCKRSAEASEDCMVARGIRVENVPHEILPDQTVAIVENREHGEDRHPESFQATVRLLPVGQGRTAYCEARRAP